MSGQPWVVLKFGGTSVSSAERWSTIADRVAQCQEAGERPLLVCSAVSQVSNMLELAIQRAVGGSEAGFREVLGKIRDANQRLASELGVDLDEVAGGIFADLERLLLGCALLGEVSPKQHARILSAGELISTRIGAQSLNQMGVAATLVDAREVLQTRTIAGHSTAARYLEAQLDDAFDPALAQRLNAEPSVVVTQGFIARTTEGDTALLGRGGSDTSAALFAAKIGAIRCEIWTDVPGMFTADPRRIPHARLIRQLGYDEAQELATMGAKVLHPRCIAPLAKQGIPLHIRCTPHPEWPGTEIGAVSHGGPAVHAVSAKRGVTLVRMDTVGMWQQVGFLANVFACFERHGLSVDLVSTSETNVTVSLDASSANRDEASLTGLLNDLSTICEARTIGPCSAVSVVGRNIRAMLHRLGPAFEAFEEHQVHLVTQAASDLNLTVVVDEGQAERLVSTLHSLMFEGNSDDRLGPSWNSLTEKQVDEAQAEARTRWWQEDQKRLLSLAAAGPTYVIHGPTVDWAARALTSLDPVDRVLYAVKANPHPEIIKRLHAAGVGFECVSIGEIERVLETVPDLDPQHILFTPNFASRAEYEAGFAHGVRVGLDALHPLRSWPEVFAGQSIQVRVDPGTGKGHHDHVRTAGARSKFGISEVDLPEVNALAAQHDVKVVGLHAHAGSGILTPGHWSEMAAILTRVGAQFPDLEYLDLGGGLGVPERPGQSALDLEGVRRGLEKVKAAHPRLAIWIEPGRFLVALAGVLLARVTQRKTKSNIQYVGVETGMNSLIRPALYGAWHDIVNLSKLREEPNEVVTVVGPICESADTLGRDRLLASPSEGDVLLVDVTGAYGRSMSSQYNLREPAREIVLD